MKKQKVLLILGIILTILLFISFSYAYYIKAHSQENSNIVKTKCLNLNITNEKNDIELDEQYPIPDSEGKKLTPYQFTITNTCEQFISYNVNLEALEGTTMDSSAIKVMVNNEAPANFATLEVAQTSINNSVESRTLVSGSLGSGDSVDYALRLWMDYGDSVDLSSMNKVFNSKVVVTATIGTYKPRDYVSTLHDALLVNEYAVTNVNNAISKIEAKGQVDLSNTAPIIKWIEKTGESTNIQIIKPSENAINSDDQTSELTKNATKITLFKSKTFDSTTGKYLLLDPIYVDPAEVDFSTDQNYYLQTEYISYNQNTKKLYVSRGTGGLTIFQVTGATKVMSTTTWNNVLYDSITYNLNVITLSSVEQEMDKSDMGIYQAEDDYGTTYYYRGNIKNNNVYFAGYYWQVVRINGDGSIRLLYNGVEKNATGVSQSISTYQFNSQYNNPAFVGYMYGDSSGTSFDEVHSNINDSLIKKNVDAWYKTNIEDKGYSGYISNAVGFCGDRTIYSGGNGIQTDLNTSFGAYGRYTDNTAQFTCPNVERDLYTSKDASIGNRALTYPVGLITYDEQVFAGMDQRHINKLSWAYSSQHYWTMSPCNFNAANIRAYEWLQNSTGYLSSWSGTGGARPVINLKADVEISGGIGTINDPYTIKEKS